jgi:hypothetical protein
VFVGGVGFLVGTMLAIEWFGAKQDGTTLLIALAVGVVCAVISIFLQRVLVAIAGFLAGGYLLYPLALNLGHEPLAWIAFLVGGFVSAVLVSIFFDWALIILSSVTGARAIVQCLTVQTPVAAAIFVALVLFGIVVQARQLRKAPLPAKPQPAE